MKKAIQRIKRFMSNSFDWPEYYGIEFIKDIIGGFTIALFVIAIMFLGAIMG